MTTKIPESTLKRVGMNLAVTRRERGLTQAEAADLAGITRKDVSRLENGVPGVAWSKLYALVATLGNSVPGVAAERSPDIEAVYRAIHA
ncbi:helix-turn-helix domain-containing protein [Brevibacterium linens]|uniref:helix-turn-helix transcriptional regulator n=1 Tax=Brevibacterium linens TaxID=1703 RepID=UPI001122A985